MTRCSWRHGLFCITGYLGDVDVPHEPFASSCIRRFSPLWWRVPILIWAMMTMLWSLAFFWGPIGKFFVYMTHWGLFFIVVESIFGILVAVRKPCGRETGMLCVDWLKRQCVWRMYKLEHPLPSEFYVSCWQNNKSSLPLLVLRSFLFFLTLSVLVSSIVIPLTYDIQFGYWFIYFSNWSFLLIVITFGFSTNVSAQVYFKKPIDATFGLPWYVKTYWVLYNITIPVAFLITVFYWGVIKSAPATNVVNYAPDPVLDIMVHAVNSGVMLVELIFSAHPSRLLHVMQPLYFAGAYMLFTVIYYFAGGLDPWGNPFVYPVVDWSKPEQTMVVITLTALFLALMHLLTMAIASVRDTISKRRTKEQTGVYNDGFSA